jgi:GTPase SAR1 family protein
MSCVGTDLFVICFSVTNASSFDSAKSKWLGEIEQYCPGAPFILVGTKTDLREDSATIAKLAERGLRILERQEGVELAKEIGTEYFECSALKQEGMKEIFDRAIQIAWEKKRPTSKRKCCIM